MSDTAKNRVEKAVDDLAGAGTADKIEGKTREMIGKGQQAVGEAVKDDKLQAEGIVAEVAGKAQQVRGDVRNAVDKATRK